MSPARFVIGMMAAAILVLSSSAHSLLGWRALKASLEAAQVTPDLILSLGIGWHFGGVSMLTLGCVAIATFSRARRDHAVSLVPTALIAVAYVVFGTWAFVMSGNPFFLLFIVPGLMFGFASLPSRKTDPGVAA